MEVKREVSVYGPDFAFRGRTSHPAYSCGPGRRLRTVTTLLVLEDVRKGLGESQVWVAVFALRDFISPASILLTLAQLSESFL